MKRFFIVLALSFSSFLASAAPAGDNDISINFDKVPVITLINFVYGDLLKQNFAVHPDLMDFSKSVTVHFDGPFDRSKLGAFMVDLFQGVGITVTPKRGYIFIAPKLETLPESGEELFFYRSKYRSISYLTDLTSSLFKVGRFSTQRTVKAITSSTSEPQSMPTSGALAPAASKVKAADSGTSATSLIDKSQADSFIFQGTESEIVKLQKLLVQIDTPVGEVVVKGTVYEVTTNAKQGSAFNLALNLMGGTIGINFGTVITGDSITFKNGTIDSVFAALSADSRFKSISNPSLRVQSGTSARFSVGSDVPVLGAVQLDKNGNPVQSVQYKPSGVIFGITPQIRDNVIDLAISQQLSSFVPTVTGVNNSPTLIKREISTSIGAADGDIIVLGGLDEQKDTGDKRGFSFLPDWSKSQGGEASNTQILLVLQVQKI